MNFWKVKLFILCVGIAQLVTAQGQGKITWSADGNTYSVIRDGNIVQIDPASDSATVIISKDQLEDPVSKKYLEPQSYAFNENFTRLLVFTNTAKVWRDNTRGDYWLLDIISGNLKKLGKGLEDQSLMFAKFSPNGKKVAYVSKNNIYAEDLTSGEVTKLTLTGEKKLINGTFDWAYEEEFGCKDGFRWSPDGSKIAFWQVDATDIQDYYMLNTTDDIYSKVIPVEYPKVGEAPSSVRIGVVSLFNRSVKWMNVVGDPRQHYLPRMAWAGWNNLVVQQLNRKQQESKLIYCDVIDGSTEVFYTEKSATWIEVPEDEKGGWHWIKGGSDFLWVSEKDGWRHIYKISKSGKVESLITDGDYDIGEIKCVDEVNNFVYFTASPDNATELYVARVMIDKGNLNQQIAQAKKEVVNYISASDELVEKVAPKKLKGTHTYDISPNGKYAFHSFSSYNTPKVSEWITLANSKPINPAKSIAAKIKTDDKNDVEYVKITLSEDIVLDAWINKPKDFDPTKKYPVVFYVYGEPASSTVQNRYGAHRNFLYNGDIRADGYVQVAIDNRGTPMLKGAAWRKSIYRKVGNVNVTDMANGFKKLLETKPYLDAERTAVWGWSGGGSSTLNLLFRYPDMFKTGISIAAVSNQLFYDNIYQERYMGLPQENKDDFLKGSPITYAKNLQGNLLYIHGTGDDNVHFSNAEVLVNELVKYNKQFQYMPYPNRSHSISEGPGTFLHLSTLYTNYLKAHCPPGAR